MKHWSESRQVFDWLSTLAAEQRHAALATVVRVRGSAYRREGARMAIASDGAAVGNVSGGCLEGDVREVGLQVVASQVPQLRRYCSGTDPIHAWDLGVGCEGEVWVYVEPAAPLSVVEEALFQEYATFAVCREIVTAPGSDSYRRIVVTPARHDGSIGPAAFDAAILQRATSLLDSDGDSTLVEIDQRSVFVEIFRPPPKLVILSAGNDARALARLGVEVGFRVVVVDRRRGLLLPERFPVAAQLIECETADLARMVSLDRDTYAVIMTHNFADDEQYLRALAGTAVPYIGMLGPRQRTERIINNVAADISFDTERVYGPVGLDVGTDGAEQVALAIIAETLAVRGGRRPASLRQRGVPIHVANPA